MSDILTGELVANNNGVWFVRIPDAPTDLIIKRKVKTAKVQLVDSRPLSAEQRKMCYALIHAISDWSGQDTQSLKEMFKLQFMAENIESIGNTIFSLSNAPMSLVAGFQRFLVRFIIENDIPVKRPLLEYVDDVKDYTYHCLINKKCAVCGKKADLHHLDAVGMGRDRDEIVHEGLEVISLCREHHSECHTIGQKEFMDKYHLDGGITADKTICKIYKIKGEKK